jgi:hypothetical protein
MGPLGERPRRRSRLVSWRSSGGRCLSTPHVDRATCKEFAEPGFAKTVDALGTRPIEDKTLLCAIMRTATAADPARTWFRRYWTCGVGYGAHVLVHGLLDVVREDAERRQAT